MTRQSDSAAARTPGEMTRRRILDAARELFAANGYERTTVKAIASRLEITDPALYYHFRSKRQILDSLLAEGQPDEIEQIGAVPVSRDQLIARMLAAFRAYTGNADHARLSFVRQYAGEPSSNEHRRRLRARYEALLTPPFKFVYGDRQAPILGAVLVLAAGIIWDAIIAYGDSFAEVVTQESFISRVRAMYEIAMPEVPAS